MLTDSQAQAPLGTQVLILGLRNIEAKPLTNVESRQTVRCSCSTFELVGTVSARASNGWPGSAVSPEQMQEMLSPVAFVFGPFFVLLCSNRQSEG